MNTVEKRDYNELLKKFQELYDIIYPLIPGPNKYRSMFGEVLAGVARKDLFTMQTILTLIDNIEIDKGNLIVFSGPILDLSRRIFEDQIAMTYINVKGRSKYSKRLHDYIAVEDKEDLVFLDKYQLNVDEEWRKEIEEKYSKLSKKIKERKNWAGIDIEGMINFIAQQTNMSDFNKDIVLKEYTHGNRKNHVSAVDVWVQGSFRQDVLEHLAEGDISIALAIASQSMLWVALFLVEQMESSEETKEKIHNFWKKISNGKEPPLSVLTGKD